MKSTGFDHLLTVSLIENLAHSISKSLSIIINLSLYTGIFSEISKETIVVAIYKKGNIELCSLKQLVHEYVLYNTDQKWSILYEFYIGEFLETTHKMIVFVSIVLRRN